MKTVREQIEEVVQDMCNHFCKYPDTWDPEVEGYDLAESEHCQNCPLNRL